MAKTVDIDDFEAAYSDSAIDRLMVQITPEQQEETDFKMKLAAKIYAGMKAKGWTQTRFAEAANQHVSVVSKWLSGTHNFTVDTLVAIQRMLSIQLLNVDEVRVRPVLDAKATVTSVTSVTRLSEEEIRRQIYMPNGPRLE